MLAGVASDISQQVLRTDVAGMPLEWIDYREAVRLYHADQVAYDCGTRLYTVFGGYSSFDGKRSKIDVNSIIATHGTSHSLSRNRDKYVPPLNNRTLFKRDGNLCLYCAMRYPTRDLTRDHITPISQGGRDLWTNVATACRRCNNYKGGRTPEQAAMELIAVPFTPTYAEYIYLKGRRVLAGQLREQGGQDIRTAAADAGRLRFRAVCMTAVSFILGILPLVFASGAGAFGQRSLGITVFGGMLAALLVGTFFIPGFYAIIQTWREGIGHP